MTYAMGAIKRLLLVAWILIAYGANANGQVGPLEIAIRYFEAIETSRCSEAFGLYTKSTQENIRAALHRYEREQDESPITRTVETWSCNATKKTARGSVRLVRQDGNEAVVTRVFTIGHWLNKYIRLGQPYSTGSDELRLLHEDGVWRVELPRYPVGRRRSPGEKLVEVGRVDVSSWPHNSLGQDVVEATVISHVPRSSLESVLRDPVAWASLFPYIQSAEDLEVDGDTQRVRLHFSGWQEPIIISVKTPDEHIDKLRFNAGQNAPIMFWGWWKLSPRYDGIRVSLYFVINKRQWQDGLGERLIAPERISETVLGLEMAAIQ